MTDTSRGTLLGLLVILAVAIAMFMLVMGMRAQAAWQNVAQEWEPYRLNESQKEWFRSIRSPNKVRCCDISDGHPTQAEHCSGGAPNRPLKSGERNICDGYGNEVYLIPDPIHLEEPRQWIPVPKEAVVKGAANPVGVATVWYVQQSPDAIYIRCFVPEAET